MDIETYINTVVIILTGLIGLCVGSFMNVVIYRVPEKMSIAFPASHCPVCKTPIKWYDNIPVISYLVLGGKCRSCKTHIPFRYTAVEIANCLLWLLCLWRFRDAGIIYAIAAAVTCSSFICIFFIDLEHLLIFDRFQIIIGACGIAFTVLDALNIGVKPALLSHLSGAVVGLIVFMLLAFLGKKVFGKEALGGGDIKLSAVCGLLLGWEKWLLGIFLASLVGSIILLILNKKSEEKGREYPFGPFLTAGFAVALLFGDTLINAYMSLITPV